MLEYLYAHGAPMDADSLSWAAAGGELAAARWCHAHGSPLSSRALEWAAFVGSNELVAWLHNQGGPSVLTSRACAWAASNAHLDTLSLLKELGGCPFDVEVAWFASDAGHDHVVRWLAANGCPMPRHLEEWLRAEADEFDFLCDGVC